MKNIAKLTLVFAIVASLLLCAFPAMAERWVFEDGKIPEGWDRIKTEEDVHAVNIMGPINPYASQEAKNLYAYLSIVGDSQQMIVGQFDIARTNSSYEMLVKEFNKEPGLYATYYDVDESTPEFGGESGCEIVNSAATFPDAATSNALLKMHYDNGNIVDVHSDGYDSFFQAVAAKNKPDLYPGGDMSNAIRELDKTNPDRDMQTYNLWMAYMKNTLDAFEQLEAMGVKAYLWRPWVEFNGRIQQNGVNEEGYAHFVRVYQQTIQMAIDRKLTGFLVIYGPAGSIWNPTAERNNTMNRYPGNDYVDTFVMDLYSDNIGELYSDMYPNYEWYCRTGKPLGFGEISCRTADVLGVSAQARSSDFTMLQNIMEYWPRVAWCNHWGDEEYSPWNHNGDPKGNDDGLLWLDSPFTISLDEMVDYRQGVIDAPGIVQLFDTPDASGKYQGLEERVYTASDLQKLGINLSKTRALRLNIGYGIRFYKTNDATGEYWGYSSSTKNISTADSINFKSCEIVRVQNIAKDQENIWASVNDGNAYKANDGKDSHWDGDLYSQENESEPGTAWLMIDLGVKYNVGRYIVKNIGFTGTLNGKYNNHDFQLQISDDGETWTTVDTVKDNTANQVDRQIKPVTAQYFRLYITRATEFTDGPDKGYVSVCEIELYGMDGGNVGGGTLPEKDGLYKINGEWVYVKDQEIQYGYNGFVKHEESNTWFYVTDGKIDWNLEGAFKHPSGIWFIVKGGQIDWSFNGFYKANGVWFYFKNGQIVWETTGLYKHPSGTWFYVKNAQIDWGYTGFAKHNESNTWFYCENGTIAWSKSGAFKHPSGIWFMVNGGQIDWKYNGFYKVSGIWFYFENGQINWNLTGLYKLPSANAWFYVKNAQIDWSYNGKATKNGVTFNVRNGQVIF